MSDVRPSRTTGVISYTHFYFVHRLISTHTQTYTHTHKVFRDGSVIFTFCTEIREAKTNNIPRSTLPRVYDTLELTMYILN